jgi:hypothetical protein
MSRKQIRCSNNNESDNINDKKGATKKNRQTEREKIITIIIAPYNLHKINENVRWQK